VKSVALMAMAVTGALATATAIFLAIGIHIRLSEPLAAIVIATTAGAAGVIPLLAGRAKDAASLAQMALVGTLVHLLASVVLAPVFIECGVVSLKGAFAYWLLAGYWVSLLVLIGQLRRLFVSALPQAKG
jgi:hypothetical protein